MHHFVPFAYADQRIPIDLHLYRAVDVFFALSGYVLAYVYLEQLPFTADSFRSFAVHRVSRIVPLAWLTVVLFFAAHLGIHLMGQHMNHPLDISAKNFFGNLLFLDSNIPGFTSASAKWSVSNEMAVYFAIFPLIYLLPRSKAGLLTAFFIIASSTALLWGHLVVLGPLFARCIPGFLCGAILYLYSPDLPATCSPLLAVGGAAGFLWAPDRLQPFFATAIVASAISDQGPVAKCLGNRAMTFLGSISYSLYLLHGLLVLAVAAILSRHPSLRLSYPAWMAIPLAGSVLLASASFRYFEQPCRSFLNRWLVRPTPSNALEKILRRVQENVDAATSTRPASAWEASQSIPVTAIASRPE